MRAICALTALVLASSSCAYTKQSLPMRAPPDGAGLPNDARAEFERRRSRRLWSFVGSAVEIGLGVLAHLAARGSGERDAQILDGVSQLFFVFGAGDLALATVDSALSTPFVNAAGDFERPDHFVASDVPPSARLQADAGMHVSVASQRRVEGHFDAAVFHWVTPTLRLRYQLTFDRGVTFAASHYYGAGGGASIEWSPRRWYYGRHPSSGLAFTLLPRVVFGSERDTAFGLRATLGWELGAIGVGIGATQIFGDDSRPGVEAWFGMRVPTD